MKLPVVFSVAVLSAAFLSDLPQFCDGQQIAVGEATVTCRTWTGNRAQRSDKTGVAVFTLKSISRRGLNRLAFVAVLALTGASWLPHTASAGHYTLSELTVAVIFWVVPGCRRKIL